MISSCPYCKKRLAISERLLGTVSTCRGCGGKILLPGIEGGDAKPVEMPPLPKPAPAPGAAFPRTASSTALELPEPDNLSSQALAVPPPPAPEPAEETPSPAEGIAVGAAPPWRALPHDALAPPLPGSSRPGRVEPQPPAGSPFLASPDPAPSARSIPPWAIKGGSLAVIAVAGLLVTRHFLGVAAAEAHRKESVIFNDAIVRLDADLLRECDGFRRALDSCVEGTSSVDDLGPKLANLQRIVGKAEADHRALKAPPGPRSRALADASAALLAVERKLWFDDIPKRISALQLADAPARKTLLAEAVETLSKALAEAQRLREVMKAAQKAFAEESGIALVPGGV